MSTTSVDQLPDETTLQLYFAEFNNRHFNGAIPAYVISYNNRFSSVAGRITYKPPRIEISRAHHRKHPHALRDTLLHEMIHAWCYAVRGETGHGVHFKRKMRELGLRSIYHDMGSGRAFDPDAKRYILVCDHCATETLRKRRPSPALSCARCGRGRFNAKFLLRAYEITGLREAEDRQPILPEPAAAPRRTALPRLRLPW